MSTIQHISEQSGINILNNLQNVGEYSLGAVLGEGRFGIVFKGNHIHSGEDVAIKFLKIWSVPDHARPNLKRRFELEFETGQIKSDFLINSIKMDQIDGIPYFVMDFCSGGNLERLLQSNASEERKTRIAENILYGLHDLHRNGKIHRDLKPENVLFDNLGNPRLTDFGISGHINIQLTVVNNDDKPEQVFGSYAYMAPEQLSPTKRKNTLLPTIDIFSFGVVCFELMTGKLPFGPWNHFDDIDPYIRRAAAGDHDELEDYIDPLWRHIIHKCLIADREQRFQNIGEILSLLNPDNRNINQVVNTTFSLQILDGEEFGRIYPATVQSILRMGRESDATDNEIALQETISNYISRRHATFENIEGEVYIRDGQWDDSQGIWCKSKNGTYVNGIKINPNDGLKLYRDDIITIGNTSIKIF